MKIERELFGRLLSIEEGKFAYQANSSVIVKYGDTVVLVTAVLSPNLREEIDFFPLVCDYEERLYAAGKIPGGFIKREGKPSEQAILTSRLIDRPIRPLFPEGFLQEVQIVATTLSVDLDSPPDILSIIGASTALSISEIPFLGPLGVVRIGRINNEFIINPGYKELEKSSLDIVVCGNRERILMIECVAKEVKEEIIIEAIEFAREPILKIIEIQEELVKNAGKEKISPVLHIPDEELVKRVREISFETIKEILSTKLLKKERETRRRELEEKVLESLKSEFPEKEKEIKKILTLIEREVLRENILYRNLRPDGRDVNEIRKVSCEVGFLPRVHGSGLFNRGETQVLTIATLGAIGDEQIIDGLTDEESKRFMHQYNFPPFSVGEVRPIRGPARRDIGHGALAEKALLAVIPPEEEFPYTIRLVSEVLSSNGSTSMASVCGSTLALMDAGVKIKEPVSGIAMGLIKENDKEVILSDIQGIEDAFGDMDFKIAGTKNGITAIQLDVKKKEGLPLETLSAALFQAKEGRMYILEEMLKVIDKPRKEPSKYAPRIFMLNIPVEKIGDLIGPGGKTIKKIIEETDVKIDIDDKEGKVYIYSGNPENGEKAKKMVETITRDIKVGDTLLGKVTRIADFGVFVEVAPNKEGLIHISELSHNYVSNIEDIVKVGEEILVKVIKIDEFGRLNLSRKALLPPPPPRIFRRRF